MAYTDYQFYTTKYFGDAVTEEEFPKYAERASERVDSITFDRLADGLPEDVRANTKVQKAVCAVAEALHQIDSIRICQFFVSACQPLEPSKYQHREGTLLSYPQHLADIQKPPV